MTAITESLQILCNVQCILLVMASLCVQCSCTTPRNTEVHACYAIFSCVFLTHAFLSYTSQNAKNGQHLNKRFPGAALHESLRTNSENTIHKKEHASDCGCPLVIANLQPIACALKRFLIFMAVIYLSASCSMQGAWVCLLQVLLLFCRRLLACCLLR